MKFLNLFQREENFEKFRIEKITTPPPVAVTKLDGIELDPGLFLTQTKEKRNPGNRKMKEAPVISLH